jgi:proteasome accessory factor B
MKVERRLLSLVALLRRARHPLSRAEIVRAMARMDDGYRPDRPEAARKKLRRDLDQLRELGVIVRWDPAGDGYVLAPSAREPVVLRLDEDDAELLVEAVRRLTDAGTGALGPAVESALEQHEARELRGRDEALVVHEPAEVHDPALFEALVGAAWHRRRVRFDYVTLDGRAGRRAVEPWGVFRRGRAWHLLGRDEERAAPRCYRLVAVRGLEVVPGDGAFVRPDGPEADVRRWASLRRWQWAVHAPVEVELVCDGVATLVARAVGGRVEGDRVCLDVTNLDGLEPVLWDWAPRVRPTRPAALVERFAARVRAVAARHREVP